MVTNFFRKMLDIPQQATKQSRGDRVNLRLSEKLKQDLEKFCDDKKIKSRSKVCKSALSYCLNGKSEIDFKIKSQNEVKPIVTEVKTEKKVVLPNYVPSFHCNVNYCSDDSVHPNENYTQRPSAICSNCNQFAREVKPRCAWCLRYNTLQPLTEYQLDKIGIPKPSLN